MPTTPPDDISLPQAWASGALVSTLVDIANIPARGIPSTGLPLRYSPPISMPRLLDNSLEELHREHEHQVADGFQILENPGTLGTCTVTRGNSTQSRPTFWISLLSAPWRSGRLTEASKGVSVGEPSHSVMSSPHLGTLLYYVERGATNATFYHAHNLLLPVALSLTGKPAIDHLGRVCRMPE